MITLTVNYEAKSIDECFALLERGAKVSVSRPAMTTAPDEDRGPNERKYLDKTRKERFRLTQEEKTRVSLGQVTREDIARERLTALANGGDTQEKEINVPQDDGGNTY